MLNSFQHLIKQFFTLKFRKLICKILKKFQDDLRYGHAELVSASYKVFLHFQFCKTYM
jgi:hypothetical protein